MKRTIQGTIFLLIALFLGLSLTRNIFSYKDKIGFYNEIKADHDKEKALNKKLKSDLKKSSDYYFVERQIRDKLNLIKEDEIAIIIPEITPSPTPTPIIEKEPYQEWFELYRK